MTEHDDARDLGLMSKRAMADAILDATTGMLRR